MRIILSPAKTMVSIPDNAMLHELPCYIDRAEEILKWIQKKSKLELQAIWNCSDKIAEQNMDRLSKMDLHNNLTPAILAYDGAVFQHINPTTLSDESYTYLQVHLRILSAFYGVLRPMEGITPYRLEMQSKVDLEENGSLYNFWGSMLYEAVRDDTGIILNLASKEYSKAVVPYLTEQDRFITVSFYEGSKGKLITKGTYAKMARGEMVRYMAENNIDSPDNIKDFTGMGYHFQKELSSETEYIFSR